MPILIGKLIDFEANIEISRKGKGAIGSYRGTALTIKSKDKEGKDSTEVKGLAQKYIDSNPQILQDLMVITKLNLASKPLVRVTMKATNTDGKKFNSVIRVEPAHPEDKMGFFYTPAEKAEMDAQREEERGQRIAAMRKQAEKEGGTPEQIEATFQQYLALIGGTDAKSSSVANDPDDAEKASF